ncbi:MAG: sigma-70 family RNA polymerase sigma factor [Vicinamibacterales bacterium]
MTGTSVSVLLARAREGDQEALKSVVSVLYQELHAIAARQMGGERHRNTLQPTALVNEAFVRLLPGAGHINDKRHFLALAATTMRRVLVDYARQRRSQKRGQGVERVTLVDDLAVGTRPQPVDVLDLDEALTELAASEPRQSQVIELKFFGGHTDDEIADILGVSTPTVRRDWTAAKAWLKSRLRG